MGTILEVSAFAIAIVGLLLEGLVPVSMAFYPVRRLLPFSPFYLSGVGFLCFVGGLILAVVGHNL